MEHTNARVEVGERLQRSGLTRAFNKGLFNQDNKGREKPALPPELSERNKKYQESRSAYEINKRPDPHPELNKEESMKAHKKAIAAERQAQEKYKKGEGPREEAIQAGKVTQNYFTSWLYKS